MAHQISFGRSKRPAPPVPSRRLITPKELPEKGIHYHANHLRRLWQRGKFPMPVYTSERRFAWPEEVIDQWIDDKIADAKRQRGVVVDEPVEIGEGNQPAARRAAAAT